MSINLRSSLSNDHIWFGLPVRLTRMAGSLTRPRRFLFGLKLAGGICRVTLKRVCLPSSSARTFASRASELARTMSSRSCVRLLRNCSSFSWAQRSERGVMLPLRKPRCSHGEIDDDGDIGDRIDERRWWNWRSYSCRWRCRARCLSSSCCFSNLAMAAYKTFNSDQLNESW